MPNNFEALTTISKTIFALFSVLTMSACEDPFAAMDEEDGLEAALDWDGAPALQEAPPPEGFTIEEVTTNGKGCPNPASVDILTFSNKTLMRIFYDDMVLEQSPGQTIHTISCTTAMKLQIPAGWQVAPRIVTTRGYADLDANITARRSSNMFFAGVPIGIKFDTKLKGPHANYYQGTDLVPPDASAWSSCGGSTIFSISNSLVLNAAANPEGEGLLTLRSQRLLSWQFKKC